MALPHNFNVHGRRTRSDPRFAEAWSLADDWNAVRTPADIERNGEWIPASAVKVAEDELPRPVTLDTGYIDAMVAAFDDLPPITVQRDTFVLIGGLHRLHASTQASYAGLIRAREVDAEPPDIWWAAFQDNVRNAYPYTVTQRTNALRRADQEGRLEGKTNKEIARSFGLNPHTVGKYLDKIHPMPARNPPPPRSPVQSFDPGPEWHDQPEEPEAPPDPCIECGSLDIPCGCTPEPQPFAQKPPEQPHRTIDTRTLTNALDDVAFARNHPSDQIWAALTIEERARLTRKVGDQSILEWAAEVAANLSAVAWKWSNGE
ncbi:MAG: hypothetical protein ACKVT1_02405 [Dehalococcoidia bacterium]